MKTLLQILIIIFPTLLFSQTIETFISDTANIQTAIYGSEYNVHIIKNFKNGHWIVYPKSKKHWIVKK